MPRLRKPASPFRYFNSSPEVIRLVVLMYVRFPLSLRNVEDLLFERGIDICHETVRFWWNRFGPLLGRCQSNCTGWRWGTRWSREARCVVLENLPIHLVIFTRRRRLSGSWS